MINTIIFDFAGVVTKENYLPVLIKACKEKFGLDEVEFKRRFLDIETPFMLGEISCMDFWEIVCEGKEVPFEEFANVFENAYEINPDMIALIRNLKKHYHVVMLSDNFDRLAENIKSNAALEGLFEHLFFSNEIHFIKKTVSCFEYVLKQLGKEPNECIFTDDKNENVQRAVTLGIHGIYFVDVEKFRSDLHTFGVKIGD